MILFLVSRAFALDCSPWTSADLNTRLDAFDAKIAEGESDGLIDLISETKDGVRCLDRVVLPSEIARIGHDMALAKFFDQDEDEAVRWGHAAEVAFPGYPWPAAIDATHPLRNVLASAAEPGFQIAEGRTLLPAKDTAIFLDGRFIATPEARSDVPALVQVFNKNNVLVDAWWQDGGAFPETILGTGTAPPKRPTWAPVEEDASAARAAALARYGGGAAATTATVACTPMSPEDFTARVDEADEALGRNDLAAFGATYRQVKADAACMMQPVPREAWARLLVGVAAVEFPSGLAWTEPLATALAIFPAVPRNNVPPEVAAWQAPGAVPGTVRLPASTMFYVDGRQVATIPDMTGLHMVQRDDAGTMTTRILRNQPFPADWLPAEVVADAGKPPKDPKAPKAASSGSTEGAPTVVVAVAGLGIASQNTGTDGDYVPTEGTSGLAASLASFGHVPVGPLGVFWDGGVGINPGGLAGEAFTGLSLGKGPQIDLGGGFATATLMVNGEAKRYVVPQARLGAGLGLPMGPGVLGIDGAIGGSQAGIHARARVGLAGGDGGFGWYGGLEFADDVAWFTQPTREKTISASGLRVAARVGVHL